MSGFYQAFQLCSQNCTTVSTPFTKQRRGLGNDVNALIGIVSVASRSEVKEEILPVGHHPISITFMNGIDQFFHKEEVCKEQAGIVRYAWLAGIHTVAPWIWEV